MLYPIAFKVERVLFLKIHMTNSRNTFPLVLSIALTITFLVALLTPRFRMSVTLIDSSTALTTCDSSFYTINPPAGYTFSKGCIADNKAIYSTDARFTFFLPEPEYNLLSFIQGPNNEIKDNPNLSWSITVSNPSKIHIMSRHIPGINAPAWIRNNYTRVTNDDLSQLIQYSKRKSNLGLIGLYDIYTRSVEPGTITLSAAGEANNPAYSMYIVALAHLATPSPSPTIRVTPRPTPTQTVTPSSTNSPSPTSVPSSRASTFESLVESDLKFAAEQYEISAQTLSKTSYPVRTTANGEWSTSSASSWTSGFFPGSMWYLYEYTRNPIWQTRAQQWQAAIESQKNDTSTHDVGFMLFDSFGNGFKQTNNAAYKQIVLTAANSLSQRFSPIVGLTRSWNSASPNFTVIIDNMMNIEMLFWAAKNGGNTQYSDMAISHALKTAQNHVRADGSTYHVVDYNQNNGAVIRQYTAQGYSDSSTWSRGQAWAIYGFTMAYRETKDTRFLETARKVADYYIAHLPSDFIAPWDFQAPGTQPKDTSSAAIAASGLLELSKLETDAIKKTAYLDIAKNILSSLSTSEYLTKGTNNKALLLHGTQNKPKGNYDTGLTFGDYYFIEALIRYKNWY